MVWLLTTFLSVNVNQDLMKAFHPIYRNLTCGKLHLSPGETGEDRSAAVSLSNIIGSRHDLIEIWHLGCMGLFMNSKDFLALSTFQRQGSQWVGIVNGV